MNFKAFEKKIWLATPTMHGEELQYIKEAYETNWMSTLGENINQVESIAARQAQKNYAVALSCCTAALHLAVKHAGETLYGRPAVGRGALEGKRVFCSDMTFAATLNPVVYEGGIPVFIDTDEATWNMDPVALEKAFELYPDVKLVVYAELYGFPGPVDEIRDVCHKHGALLIEDAAEAMGATVRGRPCGSFGDYSAVSYNGNKIITGSSGGCLLTNDLETANKARKWSTQARENAPWYQHEEVGYNYRMSNVVAGVVRGQYPYLEEHIASQTLNALPAAQHRTQTMQSALQQNRRTGMTNKSRCRHCCQQRHRRYLHTGRNTAHHANRKSIHHTGKNANGKSNEHGHQAINMQALFRTDRGSIMLHKVLYLAFFPQESPLFVQIIFYRHQAIQPGSAAQGVHLGHLMELLLIGCPQGHGYFQAKCCAAGYTQLLQAKNTIYATHQECNAQQGI
jgi:dTDP-4-amino-4,6-dideoxygalactose transaminase